MKENIQQSNLKRRVYIIYDRYSFRVSANVRGDIRQSNLTTRRVRIIKYKVGWRHTTIIFDNEGVYYHDGQR